MLNLIIGRAGTGKTALIQQDIKKRVEAGEQNLLLVVPEQYSHDAERQLVAVCGDSLSLGGETLSFTRLCGRVFLELGYPSGVLDDGGQMLVMHRAIESVAPNLRVFGARGIRIELLEGMLQAMKEFKSFRISASILDKLTAKASKQLGEKLHDLALILGAYDALIDVHGGDVSDMLSRLADVIDESTIGETGHIYFDGFNDFTSQELSVIEELLRKKADITVCLTYDPDEDNEIFEIPRRTAGELTELAKKHNVKVKLNRVDKSANSSRSLELDFIEKNLFKPELQIYPEQSHAVEVYGVHKVYDECECAADKIISLIHAGYRWRDIGVMARNWEQYSSICENVFEKYGIPFFSSGRADILDKPPIAHIDAALEIASSGWEYKPVFKYIKTGLIGITADECAMLENYVLKWNIRGSMWLRDWTLPVSGYDGQKDPIALERLNILRRKITQPLILLRDGLKGETDADVKLRALYGFLENIEFAKLLEAKAIELQNRSELRLADECTQLWDIIVSAMEQIHGIIKDTRLSAIEFRKILSLVLSRYDVGVIPVSLDRTALGSMAMSRRRDLKCLIILGATDENMPLLKASGGALSESERDELCKLGIGMPAGLEESLYREMNMIYSSLTLPSQELVVMYAKSGGSRPSFVVKRLTEMFGIEEKLPSLVKRVSPIGDGCFVMSESSLIGEYSVITKHPLLAGGDSGMTKHPLLAGDDSGMTKHPALRATLFTKEGKKGNNNLTPESAMRLYGQKIALSPSRVDKYYSCPYQHFLHSGLKLRDRVAATFDAPMVGTFMHFVLEGVAREINETVGFDNADDEICRTLVLKYIDRFVSDDLFEFEGKNARFIYLFRRLEEDVIRILTDTAQELKHSQFTPLDFELNFSKLLAGQGDSGLADGQGLDLSSLKGIVDRVDGWRSAEKLFLRVIDYKSGKKSFNLSEVMYGRDMQMLIYLFALQKYGAARYGAEIIPTGVLYVPTRDVIIKSHRGATEEEIASARIKELRRGGLLLDDPIVLDAMEYREEKQYLPVKVSKTGELKGDSLVSSEQIDLLEKHINKMMKNAAEEILHGEIRAMPMFKNDNDNACLYCDYRVVCNFDDAEGGRRRFIKKIKTSEIWEKLEKDSLSP